MVDIKALIADVARVADTAAAVIPMAGLAGDGARLVQKIIDVVEDLKPHAPDDQSKDQLEAAHQLLLSAVVDKAHKTSDRLRG